MDGVWFLNAKCNALSLFRDVLWTPRIGNLSPILDLYYWISDSVNSTPLYKSIIYFSGRQSSSGLNLYPPPIIQLMTHEYGPSVSILVSSNFLYALVKW